MSQLNCSSIEKKMSPFIDSMVSAEEAERLESHVAACPACHRLLQSFISMRSLLAQVETPVLPEDLVLETRVRLSHERNRNFMVRLENRLNYILKPIVFPALLGVSLTIMFLGVLLGSLASSSTVTAQNRIVEQPVFALFKPVRTTDPTMARFAANHKKDLDETLTIETHVGDAGRVIDYKVIGGSETPETDSWVREILSLAQFTPATAFGKPVESKIILSFVAVRN